jgi:hypothetical protein
MPARGTPEEWLSWLTGRDVRRRKEATLILGGLNPRERVNPTPLVNALASNDGDLVFWCVVGLGRLGRQAASALPELARIAAGHDRFGVRQAAVIALCKVGPGDDRAKAAVLQALDDPDPFVRREALQALIDFDRLSEQELARIKAMGRDADEAVASWSEIALRNIRLKGHPTA